MVGQTGIWSDDEAYAHDFSYGVARYIGKYFEKDKRVFDIGCGKGTYLQYLQDVGFRDLIGFDGSVLSEVDFRVIPVDLSKKIYLSYPGNVICLEVFEHIPREYENIFVQNIVNCCDSKLVLSVAVEGQPGIGHVNCRNNNYVIELMQSKGFTFMKDRTDEIRKVVENHCDYFRNTLMIFEK